MVPSGSCRCKRELSVARRYWMWASGFHGRLGWQRHAIPCLAQSRDLQGHLPIKMALLMYRKTGQDKGASRMCPEHGVGFSTGLRRAKRSNTEGPVSGSSTSELGSTGRGAGSTARAGLRSPVFAKSNTLARGQPARPQTPRQPPLAHDVKSLPPPPARGAMNSPPLVRVYSRPLASRPLGGNSLSGSGQAWYEHPPTVFMGSGTPKQGGARHRHGLTYIDRSAAVCNRASDRPWFHCGHRTVPSRSSGPTRLLPITSGMTAARNSSELEPRWLERRPCWR